MKVVPASLDMIEQYSEYVYECHQAGISHYADAVNTPHEYLQKIIDYSHGRYLPDGWVPSTTFFGISEGRILGAIRLRHTTNDHIEHVIGHVGYETRPSEWGRGVAKYLLTWVQTNQLNTDVIITCAETNLASRKVIESCGGEYLNGAHDSDINVIRLRYRLLPTKRKRIKYPLSKRHVMNECDQNL